MMGIIGGSGIYKIGEKISEKEIETPYGKAYVEMIKIKENLVYFIPRHGKEHSIPPHKINHRANIYALKKLGIKKILGIYASGIISDYKPGDLILLDDFAGTDEAVTFFDDFSEEMKHEDMGEPFNPEMKKGIEESAKKVNIEIKKGGIIKTTRGPRFETKIEIRIMKQQGINLVSMTNCYETILANELGLKICGIAVGTNYAAGISRKKLTHEEVLGEMEKAKEKINKIIEGYFSV
ncbi:MTAP family purine nucleoside phosphorylase [Candidatus Micrarchaeota archaeon]|nr:MTAP family purine nucleoside phosphorylase [Candidatus Micrarchaeota archaeon]